MKVKQIKKDGDKVTLEAVATPQETAQAMHAAKIAFAQSMGMKPPAKGQTIDEAADEQMGIKNLDSIVEAAAMDALAPIAVDKKGVIPAYPPHTKAKSAFKPNEEFRFEVEVDLKPQYELTSYDPVKIQVPPFQMEDGLIDRQLEDMAERYTAYVEDKDAPADRVVEKGDHIKLSLEAREGDKELKGLSTKGRTYTAGQGFMPEGFEKEILGMKVGETKEFSFEGPDFDEDMNERTQTVDAKVTILEFQKEESPEIDDEWVKKNMPMYKSLEELRQDIGKSLERQGRMEYDAYVRQAAAAELAKRFEGKIADEIYEAMRDQLLTNIRMDLKDQGMTWDQFVEQNGGEQQFSMMLMLQVRQMLTQGFALDAYFRHFGMTTDQDDLLEACRAMNPQANPQQMLQQIEAGGQMFALRESAERLKANKDLVEKAEIEVIDPEDQVAAAGDATDH